MIKADTKRIAWFVALQRLVHISRRFLAPPQYPRFVRSPMVVESKSQPLGAKFSGRGNANSSRASQLETPALQSFARPNSLSALLLMAKIPLVGQKAQAKGPTIVPVQRRSLSPGITAARAQTPQGHTGRSLVAKRENLARMRRLQSLGIWSDQQSGPKQLLQLAPIHTPSSQPAFNELEPHPVPEATTAWISETISGMRPYQTGDQPLVNTRVSHERYPSSSRNEWQDGERSERSKRAVSTLHIDGSALGRWAVQYLERSLGKPTMGMTGVDPRASVPRSRVAPF